VNGDAAGSRLLDLGGRSLGSFDFSVALRWLLWTWVGLGCMQGWVPEMSEVFTGTAICQTRDQETISFHHSLQDSNITYQIGDPNIQTKAGVQRLPGSPVWRLLVRREWNLNSLSIAGHPCLSRWRLTGETTLTIRRAICRGALRYSRLLLVAIKSYGQCNQRKKWLVMILPVPRRVNVHPRL
jgi:hypothetical protein